MDVSLPIGELANIIDGYPHKLANSNYLTNSSLARESRFHESWIAFRLNSWQPNTQAIRDVITDMVY
jgi:hypothetical protein